MQLHQLIYVSSARQPFSEADLLALLTAQRTIHTKLHVTGMLLYFDGSFIQVLEGPEETLNTLYKHIELDPRHGNCIQLLNQRIEQRAFTDWSMGFRANKPQELYNVEGYVDFFSEAPIAIRDAAAHRLLNSFRRRLLREEAFA